MECEEIMNEAKQLSEVDVGAREEAQRIMALYYQHADLRPEVRDLVAASLGMAYAIGYGRGLDRGFRL